LLFDNVLLVKIGLKPKFRKKIGSGAASAAIIFNHGPRIKLRKFIVVTFVSFFDSIRDILEAGFIMKLCFR
jgi:hypothetical protein